MLYKYGKRMRDFFWAFLLLFQSSFLYFGGVFNKTTIPPTPARGIIVKYRMWPIVNQSSPSI